MKRRPSASLQTAGHRFQYPCLFPQPLQSAGNQVIQIYEQTSSRDIEDGGRESFREITIPDKLYDTRQAYYQNHCQNLRFPPDPFSGYPRPCSKEYHILQNRKGGEISGSGKERQPGIVNTGIRQKAGCTADDSHRCHHPAVYPLQYGIQQDPCQHHGRKGSQKF